MYFMLFGPLLPTDQFKYFVMENVATTHSFALFARFLHFHENNDLKVPERSKNGPKKVPILSQRPIFCLCSDFSRQVPNPKSYIGAPGNWEGLTKLGLLLASVSFGLRHCQASTVSLHLFNTATVYFNPCNWQSIITLCNISSQLEMQRLNIATLNVIS